jgi:hypothetical protein
MLTVRCEDWVNLPAAPIETRMEGGDPWQVASTSMTLRSDGVVTPLIIANQDPLPQWNSSIMLLLRPFQIDEGWPSPVSQYRNVIAELTF